MESFIEIKRGHKFRMDCLWEQCCRLCLNIINKENFHVVKNFKYILDAILPSLNLSDGGKHLICGVCSANLQAAFEFKSTCISTDTTIISYVDYEKASLIDLRDIYVNEHKINISGDRKVCRLCLKPVGEEFTSVHEIDRDIFQRYVPEVNLCITVDPIMCNSCLGPLTTHSCFIKKCLDVDMKINNSREEKISRNQTNVVHTDVCIKTEVIEQDDNKETLLFKIEHTESSCESLREENAQMMIKNEDIEMKLEETEVKTERIEDEGVQCNTKFIVTKTTTAVPGCHDNQTKIEEYQCEWCSYKSETMKDLKTHHQLLHKDQTEIELYKCEICSYNSKFKYLVNRHMSIHKDPHEIKWFKCDLCDFKTKTTTQLRNHSLTHKDPSEIDWQHCNLCDFKCKRTKYLRKHHQLNHIDPLEREWYQCEKCDFKSKMKYKIRYHMVTHENPKEMKVTLYRCEACNLEFKNKSSLKNHMLVHDELVKKLYKCEVCDYNTKYKFMLTRHMSTHLAPSEIKWYRCESESCDYKSKTREQLNAHSLTHQDSKYQCEQCDYESESSKDLRKHFRANHKGPPEIRWYQCETCDYKVKTKYRLRCHMLTHNETERHECDVCHLKLKNERLLINHMLVHIPSETQWYRCDVCDYKTLRKSDLKRHASIHKAHSNVKYEECIPVNNID